ncbi:MAG: Bax inhibitor-1/YccA family protein [Candidatus Melainabacteria bacterium]|nr:Bax inhibitor-1/YccA family protein [Candidatus Melainabacteria bacterium]
MQAEQGFVTKVFNWMFLGLMATAVVSFIFATNEFLMMSLLRNGWLMIALGIGLLVMVFNLSANAHKMSPGAAATNFFIYAALNGAFLSSIFLIYTASSIFMVFCVTAATFGAMALYGATTKRDLSGIGSMAFMALLGLIIAHVVNIFMHSEGLNSLINYAGVLIFVALTAYDVQKIKRIGQQGNYHPNHAIIGALTLYLDFINLFLYLLRIMGGRRD